MKKIARIEFMFELLRVVLGLVIAYVLTLICLVLVADDPGAAIYNFTVGTFLTSTRRGILFGKFIPYVLAGCGMCFVYSSGRFSLVGEGIINFAPMVACLVIFGASGFISHMPLVINIIIILAVSGVVGAGIAMVPAYGREKLGANEMVTSVIMNYMLMNLSVYCIKRFVQDKEITYIASYAYPENAYFPKFPGSAIHSGIIVSIIGFAVACLIFYKFKVGLDIRTCGANPRFAKYSGINVTRSMFMAYILGGVFCAFAGAVDSFGLYPRYQYIALTQIGTEALVVAVLARKQPIFVPLAALVLAYIKSSATVLNTSANIPVEFVNMMQAVLIMFVAAQHFLSGWKNKVIFNTSRKLEAEKEGGAVNGSNI